MLARCARCQGTFTTEKYGRQTCPHCGSELLLADPGAPPPAAPEKPAGGAAWGAAPPPPPSAGAAPPPGGLPPPPPPGGGWAPLPPPPPAAEGAIPAPFADRARRGFFSSFFETWKLASVETQKFFGRVRIDQTGSAILFGVLAAWVGASLAALLNWASGMSIQALLRQLTENLPTEQAEMMGRISGLLGGGVALLQIVIAPLATLVWMFILAGLVHVLLLLFKGAQRGFDATLTVVAYSFGVQLLTAVPGCGSLIAFVWQLVIAIIGLGAAHRCGTGKAAAAVLLPLVLLCCCACLGIGLAVGGLGTALQHATQGGNANL
ncbi:MAG TPA: YIP1 family protein [Anaeromyxobacter sp.]|nr:YIP1 family protein [Anaeromyxobacter sp.]